MLPTVRHGTKHPDLIARKTIGPLNTHGMTGSIRFFEFVTEAAYWGRWPVRCSRVTSQRSLTGHRSSSLLGKAAVREGQIMPFREAGAVKYVLRGRKIVQKEFKLQNRQRNCGRCYARPYEIMLQRGPALAAIATARGLLPKNTLNFMITEYVGIQIKHQYGSLPPAFNFVQNSGSIGLVFGLKETRVPSSP